MDLKPEFNRIPGSSETITILWQPKFHYCNYDCFYCPVQQAREDQKHFEWDKETFKQVLGAVINLPFKVRLIIGPGGEPFISPLLRQSIADITRSSNIESVLVLSNIGVKKERFETFLNQCDIQKLSIAAAWHPTQEKKLDRYLEKLMYLKDMEVSVIGILVAVPDEKTFSLVSTMKDRLGALGIPFFPTGLQGIYKDKHYPDAYDEDQRRFLKNVMFNSIDYEYKIGGKKPGLCDAGKTYFHLDHDGTISSCMIMKLPMGNILSGIPKLSSSPVTCRASACHCQMEYWNTLDFKDRYTQFFQNPHIYHEKKWPMLKRKVKAMGSLLRRSVSF